MITGDGITRTFPGRGSLLHREPVRALRGVDFTILDQGRVKIPVP